MFKVKEVQILNDGPSESRFSHKPVSNKKWQKFLVELWALSMLFSSVCYVLDYIMPLIDPQNYPSVVSPVILTIQSILMIIAIILIVIYLIINIRKGQH